MPKKPKILSYAVGGLVSVIIAVALGYLALFAWPPALTSPSLETPPSFEVYFRDRHPECGGPPTVPGDRLRAAINGCDAILAAAQPEYRAWASDAAAASAAKSALELADRQARVSIIQAAISILALPLTAWAAWAAAKAAQAAFASVSEAKKGAGEQATRFSQQFEVAKENAAAASKSASIAEKTLIVTQRAYVDVASISQGRTLDGSIQIIVRVKNSGRTPAIGFRYFIALAWFKEVPKDFDFPPTQALNAASKMIHPDGDMDFDAVTITPAAINQHAPLGEVPFLYGRWEYDDAFWEDGTPRHRVEMSDEIVDLGGSFQFRQTEQHNRVFDIPRTRLKNDSLAQLYEVPDPARSNGATVS